MPLRLLRLFLVFSAFAWGVCIVGVFASWPQVNGIASGMGAVVYPNVFWRGILPANMIAKNKAEIKVVSKRPRGNYIDGHF